MKNQGMKSQGEADILFYRGFNSCFKKVNRLR